MADAGIGEAALLSAAAPEAAAGLGIGGAAKGAETAAMAGGADLLGPTAFGTASAFMDPAAAAAAGGFAGPTALGTAETFMGAGAGAGGLEAAFGGGAGGFFPGFGGEAGGIAGGEGGGALGFAPDAAGAAPEPFGAAAPTSAGPSNFALPTGAAPSALPPDPTSAAAAGGDVFSTGTSPIGGVSGTPGVAAPAGGGVAGAPGATPAAAGAEPSLLSKLGTGAMDSITKNPLGTALAVGGLGYNLMQGQAVPQGTPQLRSSADALAAQAEQMRSYLQSGTLPPGVKASVDQATASARARIIANHAGRGLPTDPKKNSALAQELSSLEMNASIATADIGQKLLQTGINETQMANQLYESLIRIDQTQTANTGKAIANFAAALGGQRGGGINVNLGKNA